MALRVRAAAIIVRDGALLLHRAQGDDFWALPGGRVEAGEAAVSAVVREVHEELGVAVAAGPLRFIVENFFAHAGEPFHEIGFYFTAHLGADGEVLRGPGPFAGVEHGQALEFRWFAMASLADIAIRPTFLREALLDDDMHCRHIVHRGGTLPPSS